MPGYNLAFFCSKCYEKKANKKNIDCYRVRNRDMDGILRVVCPKCGNIIVIRSVCLQFENYLHCAIERFLDEDYAETVFWLSKAKETFVQFVIELLFYEKDKTIPNLAKHNLHLSERRYGFFCALYWARFGEFLDLKKGKGKDVTEIRNKIMHDGIYPTKEDVIAYGNHIFDFIRYIVIKIKSEVPRKIYFDYFNFIKHEKLTECMKIFKGKKPVPQDALGAIGFFSSDKATDLSFKDWCKIIQNNNEALMRDTVELKS